MKISKTMTSYLTRIQQSCDKLLAVGEVVVDSELLKVALNVCAKQWPTFVEGILTRQ